MVTKKVTGKFCLFIYLFTLRVSDITEGSSTSKTYKKKWQKSSYTSALNQISESCRGVVGVAKAGWVLPVSVVLYVMTVYYWFLYQGKCLAGSAVPTFLPRYYRPREHSTCVPRWSTRYVELDVDFGWGGGAASTVSYTSDGQVRSKDNNATLQKQRAE